MLAPPATLFRIQLDVASLCEIDWFADGPAVVRSLNDTAHLTPRPGGSAYPGGSSGRAGRAAAAPAWSPGGVEEGPGSAGQGGR